MLNHSVYSLFVLRIAGVAGIAMTLAVCATAQSAPRAEAAVAYNYIHANAPPSGCGCFSMMGGSASGAFRLHGGLAAVGEFSGGHASNIAPTGEDLTLTSYLFGPRYTFRAGAKFAPFGEALVGLAHASGRLAAANELAGASSNAFGAAVGGGLDYLAGRKVVIRLVQADYLVTTFKNDADNHQNNVRLGAGVVFRFGR